jgi:gliding motility-associated-like protein
MIVSPFVDGIIEGIEFLYIVIPTSQCTIDTLIIPIADYTPITTSTSPDTMVCYDTASLWVAPQYGAPPYTYQWVPNLGLTANNIANPKAMPPQDTTYYVYVSDTTGCPPVLDSIHVEVNPKPSVSFMPNVLSGCEPLTVTFNDYTSPAIATWNWNFGDGNTSGSQSPNHTYAAGSYTITLDVVTLEGCPGQLSIPNLITAHQAPHAAFDIDPPVTSIDHPVINFVDMSNYADSWYWEFGDGNTSTLQNPEHTYDNEGIYNVCLWVETVNGCKDSVCQEAMVIVDRVEIPNIITPNGDGYNDVFYIENLDKIPDKKLLIFNRWGKKIYENNNYQNDWDGEGFSDGVYYYVLWIKTYFKEEEFNGSLTIMRQ